FVHHAAAGLLRPPQGAGRDAWGRPTPHRRPGPARVKSDRPDHDPVRSDWRLPAAGLERDAARCRHRWPDCNISAGKGGRADTCRSSPGNTTLWDGQGAEAVNASRIAGDLAGVYLVALPEAVLVLSACIVFVGGTFRSNRHLWAALSLVVLGGAGAIVALTGLPQTPDMIRPLLLDRLAIFVKAFALVGGAVLVLFSWDEVSDEHAAEYYACLLVIVAGLSLTGAANDLIMLFLALELISIPTYVLLYLQHRGSAGQESAAKYFLLSLFSTAILLFGFSYLYGMAGTTNLTAVLSALGSGEANRLPLVALIALVMIVAGLGFKIT